MLCCKRGVLTSAFCALVILSFFPQFAGAVMVFSDNFNRAVLTTGAPATYTTTVTAGDGGASINGSSFLELTNDTSGTANANGRVFVTAPVSSYSSPYTATLSSNPDLVTWTFNLRYNRTTNPGGFGGGVYGAALALAASNADLTLGDGYAIAYGNTGTPDPIRLVRYTGGLDADSNLTNIISSGASDIANVNNYASVRVTYNPTGNLWSLYLRDDGASAWSDPSTGVTSQIGSTTADSTYTGVSLGQFGFLWNYATAANQTDQFDNYQVTVAPEPSSVAMFLAGALVLMFVIPRRRARS